MFPLFTVQFINCYLSRISLPTLGERDTFWILDEGSSGCKSTQEHLVYPGHWARGQISQTSNTQNMGVGARDGFRREDHEQLNAKDSTH